MSEPSWADLTEQVRTYAEQAVAGGFDEPAEIAANAVEMFGDDAGDQAADLGPLVEELIERAVAAHLAEQATWPGRTDCDRLDDALDALTQSGIIARQNFTCCRTCGHAEIGDEMDAEAAVGIVPRGYTFYHMQTTEAAVAGQGIYLSYGAVEPGEAAGLAVGREIVGALDDHGLIVTWNGRLDACIHVELDWKRRLPTP